MEIIAKLKEQQVQNLTFCILKHKKNNGWNMLEIDWWKSLKKKLTMPNDKPEF